MASVFSRFMTDVTFPDAASLSDLAARLAIAEDCLRESLCEEVLARSSRLDACEWRTYTARPGYCELWLDGTLFGTIDRVYTGTTVRVTKRVLSRTPSPL